MQHTFWTTNFVLVEVSKLASEMVGESKLSWVPLWGKIIVLCFMQKDDIVVVRYHALLNWTSGFLSNLRSRRSQMDRTFRPHRPSSAEAKCSQIPPFMHEDVKQLTSLAKNVTLFAFPRSVTTSLCSTKTTPWVPLLLMWYRTEPWSIGSVPSALQAYIILLVPYTSIVYMRRKVGRKWAQYRERIDICTPAISRNIFVYNIACCTSIYAMYHGLCLVCATMHYIYIL